MFTLDLLQMMTSEEETRHLLTPIQQNLLTEPNLDPNKLIFNSTCLLCDSTQLKIPKEELKLHTAKHAANVIACGGVVRACRLRSTCCAIDKRKASRYHYHCYTCFTGFVAKPRLHAHVEKCGKSEPKLVNKTTRSSKRIRLSGSDDTTEGNTLNNATLRNKAARSQFTICPYCNKRKPSTSLAKHISSVHAGVAEERRHAMAIDTNNKLFLVRSSKRGIGSPVHVTHSTVPGDMRATCGSNLCRDEMKIAHGNQLVSYMCIHLRSTQDAVFPTFPRLDITLISFSFKWSCF